MIKPKYDMVGKKYGMLTVTSYIGPIAGKSGTFVSCLCDCGTEKIARADRVRGGVIHSCGCITKRVSDLLGKRFHRLFVTEFAGKDKHNKAQWKCVCDCGKVLVVVGSELRCGSSKSCGCYNIDMTAKRNRENSGERAAKWRGGEHMDDAGYIKVLVGIQKYRLKHRIIVEEVLGCRLKQHEVVHHIDGNKANNDKSNLLVCERAYHQWLHYATDGPTNPNRDERGRYA